MVIAVRVRLRTATFFGYARLCTAGCEGDARLRTVDHQCIPELFLGKVVLVEFMFKGTMCCKSPPVNSGPTKKKVVTPLGQAPVTANPSVSPPSSADVLAEYSFAPYPRASKASRIVV